MRKLFVVLALVALAAGVAIPAAADSGKRASKHDRGKSHRGQCGKERGGYVVIFDGSRRCFERWRYAGGASMTLQRDGTIRSGPGAPGLGVLWYAARPYGDFSLKLQFRDDAPEAGVPGCPTDDDAWVAVVCGHEVQINDNPAGDPRKTGSIYGFADLNIEQARPTPKRVWNNIEIRVVGQDYTVIRNGVVINEFENAPGLPFPGRPDDPGSDSRDLVGYIGLQAHGAPNDVVSFRNVRIKDLSDRD
jgi:hypothetical protein